jgi:hypothetical protein
MTRTSDGTPHAQKKKRLLMIRIAGLVVLTCAVALLWNDLPLLGAVAGAVLLLGITGFYLVEARYARALERTLAQSTK